MCHPHRDTFNELEEVTGNKLKRKPHLYFAHHSLIKGIELPKESTNLGSDMKLYYQIGKSPDCSTRTERFGTKTRSQCGILKREISQPHSHQDQESLQVIQESGKDYQYHSLDNKKTNTQKVYFFNSHPKIIHTFISM